MVTSKDVAEVAGVSPATVSRVLRGGHGVTEATRQRVNQAIAETGYQPNLWARALRLRRTDAVGVVLDLHVPLARQFLLELADGLSRYGMRPTVWNATEPGVQDALTAADQRLIDGLIWAAEPWTPGPGSTDGPTVPVPAVGLNVVAAGVDLPRVVAGDAETGQVVARHFADAGRRTVALVGADGTGVARERADGFRRGARRYDLALPPRLAIACERTPEAAARAFGEALDAGELPAAAFCVDDLVGIGVLEVLRERGLRAPDHLWVMGHDGIEAGEWRSFGLTTAAVRVRRMVDAALELLLERLAGGEARRTTVTVAPEVVVRRSTAFAPFAGLPSTGLRDGE